jgi:hypothetical protein
MSDRSYAAGVREALFSLSRGRCYAPDCQEPVVRFKKGQPRVNVQIAHIRAKSSGGPRYEGPPMSTRELDSFGNLLLLCKPDHDLIDYGPTLDEYPTELLQAWKKDREGAYGLELAGLEGVTDESLQEAMTDAITSAKEDLLGAIGELSRLNEQAARLLRALVKETFDRPYLDVDAVSLLATAAHDLRNLPDDASLLLQAAQDLHGLTDTIPLLADTARDLRGLEDSAILLTSGAQEIHRAETALDQTAERIATALANSDTLLDRAATISDWIGQAAHELPDLHTTTPGKSPQWRYFKWGYALGIATLIVVLILWTT